MSWHYGHHMLPPVHAGLFKQEGYVHVSLARLSVVPLWKAELWAESIVWFAGLNDMQVERKEPDIHGVVEITWEPR